MNKPYFNYCAVIGIDGMGNFQQFANTPNFDRIFKDGAKTNYALSMDPTISAQNWGAMLLGRSPTAHGLTNSRISQYEYTNKDYPSLFTRIRRAFPDAYLTSVCNWDPINHGLIEHDVGVDFATADNDELLLPMILERVAKKPKFLFVQFDNADGAGHHYGYGTPEHLRQIEKEDGYTGAIYDAYGKAGILDETLFIVIADHGGIRHGHGGFTDEEKYIFFGIAGKGINPVRIQNAETVDIAATVLCALGLDVPAYDKLGFSSQVPAGVFPGWDRAYLYTEPHPSDVRHRDTPAFDAENGLCAFFPGETLALAMFFENDLRDETGKCAFKELGAVKFYSNGVDGSCAEFGVTGSAETADLDVGKDSFTIAAWLYIDRAVNEDCVVCGNRSWWWQDRNANGFTFVLKNHNTVISLGCPEDHEDIVTPLPDEISNGWIHIITAVDKEKREIRVYTDFAYTRSMPVPANCLADNSAPVFRVGDDTRGRNNTEDFPNLFKMDDLLIFRGAFTQADAKKLGAYYGK